MLKILLWVWNGIKYMMEVLGNVISFKLSFIFLLCIAYYIYRAFSSVLEKSSKQKVRSTEK